MKLKPHQPKHQQSVSLKRFSMFGALLALVAFLTLSQLEKFDNQYQANILSSVSAPVLITDLKTAIQNNDQVSLNAILKNNTDLQEDLKQLKAVTDLQLTSTSAGLLINFSGLTEGDSLHPYYGLLKLSGNNKVEKITWGGVINAEKVAIEYNAIDNSVNLILRNNSYMPWLASDAWRDLESGNKIELITKDIKQTEVLPGQNAAFVMPDDSHSIVNVTRGFELVIKPSS